MSELTSECLLRNAFPRDYLSHISLTTIGCAPNIRRNARVAGHYSFFCLHALLAAGRWFVTRCRHPFTSYVINRVEGRRVRGQYKFQLQGVEPCRVCVRACVRVRVYVHNCDCMHKARRRQVFPHTHTHTTPARTRCMIDGVQDKQQEVGRKQLMTSGRDNVFVPTVIMLSLES